MEIWHRDGKLWRVKEIWGVGNWEDVDLAQTVAVVGSRHMSGYGERVTGMLVGELVRSGKTIMSGLMYGIDKTAHLATMNTGGRTVAVVGWGIQQALRDQEQILTRQIVNSGGVVISLWDDFEATRWSFPVRDKLMAEMATDIYVVEAAKKSGALLTAEWGRKLHKYIWAVPGPITSVVSQGTNEWIKKGWANAWLGRLDGSCVGNGTEICILLQNDMLSCDELGRRLKKSVADTMAELTQLQIEGLVDTKGDKYFWKEQC